MSDINKHKWTCIDSGMYDSLYHCPTCLIKQWWSVDNPETELPEFGCIPLDSYEIKVADTNIEARRILAAVEVLEAQFKDAMDRIKHLLKQAR